MKYLFLMLFFTMTASASDVLPGDLPSRDVVMCDDMAFEIESFFQLLDKKTRAGAEEICVSTDVINRKRYPLSKLTRHEQRATKRIIESLCVEFSEACPNDSF